MKRVAGTGGPAAQIVQPSEPAPPSVSRDDIEYFRPPRSLRPFVTTFFHFSCDDEEIDDIQPADVGKLMLVLKGEGTAYFRDGRSQSIPCCSLQSPTSVALPFHFTGGFHSCGAALTPLGWAALSGMPADEFGNQIFDAAEILGPAANQLCETLIDLYARPELDRKAMQGALTSFVEKHLGRVNARHARLIEVTVDWLGTSLDPDLEAVGAQHRPRIGPIGIGHLDHAGADAQNRVKADLGVALHAHLATGGAADLIRRDARDSIPRQQEKRPHHDHHDHNQQPDQPKHPTHGKTPFFVFAQV